jgi:hypothetical protein
MRAVPGVDIHMYAATKRVKATKEAAMAPEEPRGLFLVE